MRRTLLVWVLVALSATAVHAQNVRTAVVPDTVNVGDVFRVAVRIAVPAGGVVVFPDTLDVPDNVEAAARREVSIDSTTAGERTYTAVFPLTAWKPGEVQLPPARITVQLPDGGDIVEATFRPIEIESVLPPDTAQIEPQPAKDVLGPSRLIWPAALAAGVLAALLILAVWAWRRRRPAPVFARGIHPRDAALAELDRIRRLGYLERDEPKSFYSAVTDVLRMYTASVDQRWGTDLTTPELERELAQWSQAGADASEALQVISVFSRADLVKFAGRKPASREAEVVWTEARQWVASFPPEPEPEPESEPEPETGAEAGRSGVVTP